jgi:hypothetical protein
MTLGWARSSMGLHPLCLVIWLYKEFNLLCGECDQSGLPPPDRPISNLDWPPHLLLSSQPPLLNSAWWRSCLYPLSCVTGLVIVHCLCRYHTCHSLLPVWLMPFILPPFAVYVVSCLALSRIVTHSFGIEGFSGFSITVQAWINSHTINSIVDVPICCPL